MTATSSHLRARRLLTAATVAVLLAACGSDGASDAAATDAAPTSTATATDSAATAATPTTGATQATGTEATGDMSTEATTGVGASDVVAQPTVAITDSDLGEIIVDGQGRTLYLLTADSPGESTCFDQCAEAWPPLTTDGSPSAGEGADAALLGSIERDGATQVTYGDWPLYYFQGDADPGDVNGQGIESFGGVWWVVGPDGDPVEDTATAAGGAGGY